MSITELRNKRARTFEAAKAFLDSHRNTDGFLSAEDDATYRGAEHERGCILEKLTAKVACGVQMSL